MNFNYSPKNRFIDDLVEFDNENVDNDGKTCSDVLSEGTNVGDTVDRDIGCEIDVDDNFNNCDVDIEDNFNDCDVDIEDNCNDCDSRVKGGNNVVNDNGVEIERGNDGIDVNGVEGCSEIVVKCWDFNTTNIVGADANVNDDFVICDEAFIRSCDDCSECVGDVEGDIDDDITISMLKKYSKYLLNNQYN